VAEGGAEKSIGQGSEGQANRSEKGGVSLRARQSGGGDINGKLCAGGPYLTLLPGRALVGKYGKRGLHSGTFKKELFLAYQGRTLPITLGIVFGGKGNLLPEKVSLFRFCCSLVLGGGVGWGNTPPPPPPPPFRGTGRSCRGEDMLRFKNYLELSGPSGRVLEDG